jgi:hypothetical protein
MGITPIRNARDHRRTLKEIEGLMGAKRGTAAGDRLDVLVTLVEAWKAAHYPMDLPDPVAAIRYHKDQKGLIPTCDDKNPFRGGFPACPGRPDAKRDAGTSGERPNEPGKLESPTEGRAPFLGEGVAPRLR